MQEKKKSLGRGLEALLGASEPAQRTIKPDEAIHQLAIEKIGPGPFQPRRTIREEQLKELALSIEAQGIIQPIVVRERAVVDSQTGVRYEIIAGERRWLASQNAGLHEIPVVILNVDDVKSLEFAIVENIQRQDLNSIEEARGYRRLVDDFNYNQEKLSQFISKSRSYIANSLRLLSLPEDVLLMVERGNLSAGHARTLIGLNNSVDIAKKIIQKKLSVRQSEVLVKQFRDKKFKLISQKDSNVLDLQKDLEEKTGLNVSINNKKNNSGIISFEYRDLNQLDKLINVIKKNY